MIEIQNIIEAGTINLYNPVVASLSREQQT